MSVYCTKCGQLGHLYVHCPQTPEQRDEQLAEQTAILKKRHGVDKVADIPVVISDNLASKDVARVNRWREANRERYNAYMREYMREKRQRGS